MIRTIFIVPFRSLHNKYWSLKFENLNRRVELLLSVEVSRGVQGDDRMQGMQGMPGTREEASCRKKHNAFRKHL